MMWDGASNFIPKLQFGIPICISKIVRLKEKQNNQSDRKIKRNLKMENNLIA